MDDQQYEKRDVGRIPESVGTPLRMLFVRTIAGVDPYPSEGDEPTVYRCEILGNVTYPKTVGAQTLSFSVTSRTDFLYNLCADSYIEEESIVAAFTANNRLWTMDKVRQSEIIVVGHTKGATAKGTGSLSRVRSSDGSVVWTADLGSDTIGLNTYPRIPYSLDLDSRGNAYVFWQNSQDTSGLQQGFGTINQKQGVKKYSPTGNLLASYDLPNSSSSVSTFSPTYAQHAKVKVDPNNDDRIYVGCHYDSAGKWLYRFDATLSAPTWSIGPADTHAGSTGRSVGVAVASDGSIYVGNYPASGGPGSATIWHFDATGAVIDSDDSFLGIGLFVDPNDLLRTPEDNATTAVGGYGTFPTPSFSHFVTEFPTPAAGTWDGGADFGGTSGYGDGSRCVFGSSLPIEWTPTSGPDQSEASFVITDASGAVVGSGWWADAGTIEGLSFSSTTGSVFCAGSGISGLNGVIVGRIVPQTNTTLWTAGVLSSPSGHRGWSIAARTCRL